jgi:hypothetical protein
MTRITRIPFIREIRVIRGQKSSQRNAVARPADLEIGDTAGLEICATARACAARNLRRKTRFSQIVV